MSDAPKRNHKTRYLNSQNTPQMSNRQTSPLLDSVVPWVIEFRVVGTASTLQVQVRESMVVGRQDRTVHALDIDLTPYDALDNGVSRRHALITANKQRITIRDLGSANGTYLNGHILMAGKDYRLRHNDMLTLGRLQMQVIFAVTPSSEHDSQRPMVPADVPVLGHGERVLIVEDDPDVANVFSMILQHAGFQVSAVNNVAAAMTNVAQKLPDAIVLDLMLSDMNGLELARYVRAQQGGEHVRILVVSGATGGFQKNQALEAGVNLFLGKPIGVDDLIQAVSNMIREV